MDWYNWYKSLDIHHKLLVKELCIDILGCDWSKLGTIVPMRQRIEIIYEKLTQPFT